MKSSERPLWVAGLILIGINLSMAFHYVLSQQMKLGYPHDTFLFSGIGQFGDFFTNYHQAKDLNPFVLKQNYPPFAWLVAWLTTLWEYQTSLTLWTILYASASFAFVFGSLGSVTSIPLKIILSWIIGVFSYPVLFTMDRGNLEAQVFISIALASWFWSKSRPGIGDIFLSIAAAMKLFPLVFLVQRVRSRSDWRVGAKVIGMVCAINLAALLILKRPEVGILESYLLSKENFQQNYIWGIANGVQHGTSLWGFWKLAAHFWYPAWFPGNREAWVFSSMVYQISSLIIAGGVLAIIWKSQIASWKKMLSLVVAYVLIPQVSFDYRLIYFLIPLTQFFRLNDKESNRFDYGYIVLISLLFIPKDYWVVGGDITSNVYLNVLVECLLLILLLSEVAWVAVLRSKLIMVQNSGATATIKGTES